MRVSSLGLAALLASACIGTSLSAQRPDTQIDARSVQLFGEARTARAAGRLDQATDLLETALAVDPRNRAAFLLLADVSDQRGLPGTAIRLYHQALLLEPDDIAALRGQGEALVAKGAVNLARANLARIRTLCRGAACPDAATLAAAIAKGPPVTPATVAATKAPAAAPTPASE